jgi:hypothetical protein
MVDEAVQTKQSRSVALTSIGKNEAGEIVAEFLIEWSFKVKAQEEVISEK